MIIYDCFLFMNEFDLLELRLHELYETVHRFVLVEATHTHQGSPKQLYYADNKKRFEKFNDKIIHVVEDFHDTPPNSWAREFAQRNRILKVLSQLDQSGMAVISDVDEIPCAATLPEICSFRANSVYVTSGANGELETREENMQVKIRSGEAIPVVHIDMRVFYYYLNFAFSGIRWAKSFVVPVGLLKGKNLNRIRNTTAFIKSSDYCGWHFAYTGGEDKIIEKLKSFSHTEFNNETFCNKDFIRSAIERGTSLFDKNACSIVPIDETHPKYVRDNVEHYKKIGLIK